MPESDQLTQTNKQTKTDKQTKKHTHIHNHVHNVSLTKNTISKGGAGGSLTFLYMNFPC